MLVDLEDVEVGDQRGVSVSGGIAALRRGESPDALLAHARQAAGGWPAPRAAAGSGQQADGAEAARADDGPVGANAEVVAALAQALEERDSYTGEHSESVVDLTAPRRRGARAWTRHEIKTIRTAALLHDIGKVGIPDEILHKAGTRSTSESGRSCASTRRSASGSCARSPAWGPSRASCATSTSAGTGRGYPDGLAGDAIPIGARIILACDAYHAMTSDRPYRAAMSHHVAMAELTANAGSQFDPKVVEALVGYLYGRRQSGLAAV